MSVHTQTGEIKPLAIEEIVDSRRAAVNHAAVSWTASC